MPAAPSNFRLETLSGTRRFRVNWDGAAESTRYAVSVRSRNLETGAIETFTGAPSDVSYASNWSSPSRDFGVDHLLNVIVVEVVAYGTSVSDASPVTRALMRIPPSSWNPRYSLEVQWDGRTWSDESDHVISVDAVHSKDDDALGRIMSGSMNVKMHNTNGRYTDGNTSSPINGSVRAGPRIRYSLYNSGQRIPIWQGTLENVAVVPKRNRATFQCSGVFKRQVKGKVARQGNRHVSELLQTVKSDFDVAEPLVSYGTGPRLPVYWYPICPPPDARGVEQPCPEEGIFVDAINNLFYVSLGDDANGHLDGAIVETAYGGVRFDSAGYFSASDEMPDEVIHELTDYSDTYHTLNRVGAIFAKEPERQTNAFFGVLPQPTPPSDIPSPASISFRDEAATRFSATTRQWAPSSPVTIPTSWVVGGAAKTLTNAAMSTGGFVSFNMTGTAELRAELEPLIEMEFTAHKADGTTDSVIVRGNYDQNTASSVSWNAEGYEVEMDAWLTANGETTPVTVEIRIPDTQPYVQSFHGLGDDIYWTRVGNIGSARTTVFQFYAQPLDRDTFGTFIVEREDDSNVTNFRSMFSGMRRLAWRNTRARAFRSRRTGGSTTPIGVGGFYWSPGELAAGFYMRRDLAAPSASDIADYNRRIQALLGVEYSYVGQFDDVNAQTGNFVHKPFGVDTGNGVFVCFVDTYDVRPTQQVNPTTRYADAFIARQDMTTREARRFIIPGYDAKVADDQAAIDIWGEARQALGVLHRVDAPVGEDPTQALVDNLIAHRKRPRNARKTETFIVGPEESAMLGYDLNDPAKILGLLYRVDEVRFTKESNEAPRVRITSWRTQ